MSPDPVITQASSDLWSFLGVLVTAVGGFGGAWILGKRTGRPPAVEDPPDPSPQPRHEVVLRAPEGGQDHVIDTTGMPEALARALGDLAPAIASQSDQINRLSSRIAALQDALDTERLARRDDTQRHEAELLALQERHQSEIDQLKVGVEQGRFPPWPPNGVH